MNTEEGLEMGRFNKEENNGKKQPGKWMIVLGGAVVILLLVSAYWVLNGRRAGVNGDDGESKQAFHTVETNQESDSVVVTTDGTSAGTTSENTSTETTPGTASTETSPGGTSSESNTEAENTNENTNDNTNENTNENNKGDEQQVLITQAERLALGYDYEGALKLIKDYVGDKGDYTQYEELEKAYQSLEEEKSSLLLYGGEYTSITQINHIFFHSLIADNSKAFDGDRKSKGYNMYMTTISEFNKMLDTMYQDGYVLVKMADLVKQETLEDGTSRYVENEIYLRPGKKPFVISQDDVNYYSYMDGDGFATRIVIGQDGKPTCEMLQEDGTTITGAFDLVPILDAFIEKHPDFSYQGARALLALTGYEGVLGYRTNDEASPTYDKDKESVIEVARVLKEEGWEFASHSWGHKNMTEVSVDTLKRDTDRWLKEVASLIGETDIYVFPFGNDIENTVGNYTNEKYKYLKQQGFNVFVGVYKEPWMQIKKDYVRMNRRPLDGQAMLQFPERLKDLFDTKDILDPQRPAKNW
ncbi:MAG: hypothetical protein K0S04_1757 [Herbinix sp.]|nr:hypothetical protein [Herbinix sp.]